MRKLPERIRLREAFLRHTAKPKEKSADIPAQKRKITRKRIGKTVEDSVWILPFRRRGALKICTIV